MQVVYDHRNATFRAEPEHGKPVVFEVVEELVDVRRRKPGEWNRPNHRYRYVVRLKGSKGMFSFHKSFELACEKALKRATQYEQAYSVPRGLTA